MVRPYLWRSERRSSTDALCIAARRLAIAASTGFAMLGLSHEVRSEQIDGRPATFIEVVEFVQKEGWPVNLGPFCAQLDISQDGGRCTFKQVSVEEVEGRRDPRGFNVPVVPGSAIPYVLVFHLGPLIGEFFVASPQGELIKAFYRSKGTGYNLIPNVDVEQEFKKDIAYWMENFARIKRGLELERAKKKQ